MGPHKILHLILTQFLFGSLLQVTLTYITYAVPEVLLNVLRKLDLCRMSVAVGILSCYDGLHSFARTYSINGNIPLHAALVYDIYRLPRLHVSAPYLATMRSDKGTTL